MSEKDSRSPSSSKDEKSDDDIIEAMDIEQAVNLLKKVEVFNSGEDYMKQLLWAAHTYFIDFLDATIYLAFRGGRGSGKTTATKISANLAKKGEMLTDTTEAYLSTVLHEGKTVGLDEVDQFLSARRHTLIPTLLRSGYTRGAFRGYKEWIPSKKKGGKGEWTTVKLSLFGPKVLNFKANLEPALMSRTMVIDMEPCVDSDVAINNLFRRRFVLPVKKWLLHQVLSVKGEWTKEKVDELMDSEEFRKEVRALPGTCGRDFQIGAILLATSKIVGWDMNDLICSILKERKTLDESSIEYEVLDYLGSMQPCGFLPTSQILEGLNRIRREKNLRGLSPPKLAEALKDLGFRKGDDYIRDRVGSRGNPVWGIVLDEQNHERLTSVLDADTSGTTDTSVGASLSDVSGRLEGWDKPIIPVKLLGEDKKGRCRYCNPGSEQDDLLLLGLESGALEKVCPACFESKGFKVIEARKKGGEET